MSYDYDLAILGGGSGGLVAASSMSQLGMKVLLVEKERLGGDCLWHGCVPSKALLATAKRIHDIRTADELGLPKLQVKPDFKKIMKRMREVQKTIQPHDSPERFRKLGAIVEFGDPHFISNHEILLGKKRITFKYGIIATGASPFVPDIEGLNEGDYLTNLNLFQLEELPKHLVILGGGPIAVEMGQAFSRFGSKVTLLVRSQLLGKEDPELAGILKRRLEAESITVLEETKVTGFHDGKLVFTHKGGPKKIKGIPMLIATGRRPNVEGLQLEQAGVEFDKRGVETDRYLRTTAHNIFAVGDVAGKAQFTHMAASHASTAVRNIITPLINYAAEDRVVPRVTYTDPELAEVGASEQILKEAGAPYEILQFAFKDADRAIAQGDTAGKMKVFVSPKGTILGSAILGPSAGELIMEYTLAMKHGISIKDIAATIHPYPTLSGASWTLAGSFFKKFLTERNKKISQFLVRRL